MATGPEHYTEAERMRAAADEWADADLGWKANLTARERIDQRLADLADAQVHATLALAAAVGTFGGDEARSREDFVAWERVAGEFTRQAPIRAAAEARERAEEQAARDADAVGDAESETGPHRGHPHCEGCPDCIGYTDPNEPDDEGDENHYSRAQLDGEACTECGIQFVEGEPTVPSAYDLIEGQLFAHASHGESEA